MEAAQDATPTTAIAAERLAEGVPAYELFHEVGLAGSRGEARRLLGQGGGYVNDERIPAFDHLISQKDLAGGAILLRAGKKRYHRVVLDKE